MREKSDWEYDYGDRVNADGAAGKVIGRIRHPTTNERSYLVEFSDDDDAPPDMEWLGVDEISPQKTN